MKRKIVVAGLIVFLAVTSARAQQPGRVHELNASPSTTHISFFDASLEPVLRIESGDVVRLETVRLDCDPASFERYRPVGRPATAKCDQH